MLTKNQIKLIASLKNRKTREENGLFVAEGAKIVPEILSSPFTVHTLFGKETWLKENNYLIKGKVAQDKVFQVSDKDLERISQLSTPNEVLALVETRGAELDMGQLKGQLVLALDEVKDPGNLGTIIRIADWFGISHLVCSQNSVDLFNSKVIQSTMGSFTRVNVHYMDLGQFFLENRKSLSLPVYGALLEGSNIYLENLKTEGIVLMGNESRGISTELLPYIDKKMSIPSFGGAESLNVAVATAIVCSEFRRSGVVR